MHTSMRNEMYIYIYIAKFEPNILLKANFENISLKIVFPTIT